MGQNMAHQGVGDSQPIDLPANIRDYLKLRRAAGKRDPFDPASLARSKLCGHCLGLVATVLERFWGPSSYCSPQRPSRSTQKVWKASSPGMIHYDGVLHRHPVRPDSCRLCRHLVEDRGMVPVTRWGKTFVVLQDIGAGQLRLQPGSSGEGPRDWMRISIDEPWPEYEAHLSQQPDAPWPARLVRRHGLEADEALHDQKAWLSQCLKHHKRCRRDPSKDTERLPTRVIDVGRYGDAQELRLHVCEDETAPYIALSHCWGPPGSLTFKTLSSNLEAHCRSIDFEALPRTFQDAVTISRVLGIRYLWIDALCIVQDSADDLDWKREASKMDSVYSNATVVLVAAAGLDGGAGMLARPTDVDAIDLPTLSLDAALGAPFSGSLPLHIPIGEAKTFGIAVLGPNPTSKQAWRSRGWTFQEEALARRLIYFTESQCFWACKERFRSQAGQSFEVYDDFGLNLTVILTNNVPWWEMHMKNEFVKRISAQEGIFDPFDPSDISSKWEDLVRMYTTRSLTKASDRMTAIEGLAKRLFGDYYQDLYAHGASKADLARSLAWRSTSTCLLKAPADSDGLFSLPELRSIAPSWSWGSVQGMVTWFWGDPDDLAGFTYTKLSGGSIVVISLPDDFIDKYWPSVPRDWHLPIKACVLEPGSLDAIPDLHIVSSTTEIRRNALMDTLLLFLYSQLIEPATSKRVLNPQLGKAEEVAGHTPLPYSERLYYFLDIEKVEPGYNVYRRTGTRQFRWRKRPDDLMSTYLQEMSLILV